MQLSVNYCLPRHLEAIQHFDQKIAALDATDLSTSMAQTSESKNAVKMFFCHSDYETGKKKTAVLI